MGECQAKTHGTGHAYRRHGCRCPETMRVLAAEQAAYRERKRAGIVGLVDATATRRKLQALMASGWTLNMLAEPLGYRHGGIVRGLLRGEHVHRDTEAKVDALYRALETKPGANRRALNLAAKKGWAPPLAWDEDTIADPAAAPEGLTRSTRKNFSAETVWEYTLIRGSGLTHAQTLRELGISEDAWQQAARRTGFQTGKGHP